MIKRYVYKAGLSLFLAISCGGALAEKGDLPGSHDHPVISRFTGAVIVDYRTSKFDETYFPVKRIDDQEVPADALLKAEGKITYINYRVPDDLSTLEVFRNYQSALTSKGFQTVFSCQGAECGANEGQGFNGVVTTDQRIWKTSSPSATSNIAPNGRYILAKQATSNGDVYVMVYVMAGTLIKGNDNYGPSVVVKVVETRPMMTGEVQVADAASLKNSIDAQGKVAVYGIYFDTGKADIKPESKATLDQMAKLLQGNPQLKVYIVGHTDNQGALASNMDLSMRRARAVVSSLVGTYKIASTRLMADGVGSLSPVGSNHNDAGRALNRRVELVEQ